MIKNVFITGDTHGIIIPRLQNLTTPPEETALIILGDAGLNFYLNKTDKKNKRNIENMNYYIYCLRGNHEERPENLPDMTIIEDQQVEGCVYMEPAFPHIRYFIDGNKYKIKEHTFLTLGGAYSVDKEYRLSHFPENAKWTGWFKDEQLTLAEMENISKRVFCNHYDFILSHTCPIRWEPRDLFLSGLDQSKIDKSMELWLDDIESKISYDYWLFGHYHDDRLVRPGVEMYYKNIENLDTIVERWNNYFLNDHQLDWWLKKDPMFYASC